MNQIKNKIKELREDKPKGPVHEVKIQIFADDHIEVLGFPSNYNAAMDLMTAGMRRVANYFMAMAKEGKLDDKLSIRKDITPVKTPIFGPGGARLN